MANEQEEPMFTDIEAVTTEEENVHPEAGMVAKTFDLNKLSSRAANDNVKRVKMHGMTVKITNVELPLPKLKNPDGTVIKPTQSQSGKSVYFSTKLLVHFDYEHQKEYIPGIKWFVNDGKVAEYPSIQVDGDSQVSKLYQMVAAKLGKDAKDVSPLEFVSYLNLKPTVEIETVEGTFKGEPYFVNRIKRIL